jgi:hypothetical protein
MKKAASAETIIKEFSFAKSSRGCGPGSGGSVINYPPGSGSFLFIKDSKNVRKKFSIL